MPSEDLMASWRRTEGHLKNALQSLTNPEAEALSDYRHFSEHNELGLALDVLVDVAMAQRAPRTVWEALLAAAEEMNIGPDDETHGGSRRKIDDRLAAGAESFELQALLNDWDPIGVYDLANFPDDEYDCLYEPLLTRLRRGEDEATIGAFLETELRDHFGLDPQWSRPYDFAVRLVNWFAGRS